MKANSEQLRVMLKPLPVRLILTAVVFAGSLFAQRYQGRDHTIFHAPSSPAAKHASSASAASTSAAHPADATRHHDVNFSTPPTSHAAAPAQPLHRGK